MTNWRARRTRMREWVRRHSAREILFLISVWFKGFDGILELLGGVGLLTVSPAFLLQIVHLFTQDELVEDPHDLVANYLLRATARLSLATEHFMAVYLLIHGIVKIALVWSLLHRVLAAYPISVMIFAAFIAYQLYRYTLTGAAGLLALSGLDLVVIGVIWLEYRALRRGRA